MVFVLGARKFMRLKNKLNFAFPPRLVQIHSRRRLRFIVIKFCVLEGKHFLFFILSIYYTN